VNGLAVFKQNDPQHTIVHFWDARSAANSAVGLDFLAQRISNDLFNPFT